VLQAARPLPQHHMLDIGAVQIRLSQATMGKHQRRRSAPHDAVL